MMFTRHDNVEMCLHLVFALAVNMTTFNDNTRFLSKNSLLFCRKTIAIGDTVIVPKDRRPVAEHLLVQDSSRLETILLGLYVKSIVGIIMNEGHTYSLASFHVALCVE